MVRFWVRGLMAFLVLAPGGLLLAEEKPAAPTLLREVPGPKGTNDARAIFSHMDSVVFSRDGKLMAAGAGAKVYLWNVADGKERLRMQLPDEQIYHRLIFSDDGKTLIWNGREDPQVRLFDTTTGKQIREFEQPNGMTGGEAYSSRFQCYSPDGKLMAFNGPTYFEGLDLLDIASGKLTRITEAKGVRGCAFAPDGKLVATVGGEGGVHLWDVKSGRLFRELQAEGTQRGGAYRFVAWSPDSKYLATGGHSQSGLAIWSVKTRKKVCTIPCRDSFYHAAFAPDGQSILCSESDGKPYLYHLVAETKTVVFTPPVEQGLFVTWLPDGKRVAFIGNATKAEIRQQSVFLFALPEGVLNPKSAQVDDAPPEKLWAELRTENELRLDRVVRALKSAPGPTLALVEKQLPPVGKEALAQVQQRLVDLDDLLPKHRDEATRALQAVAHRFEPLLRARLEASALGEVRNRLRFILKKMDEEKTPTALVGELRALAVVEGLATPEARELLRKLAEGAPKARITEEARAALGRLEK